MDDVLRIFVGYDSKEHDAYKVCVRSLIRHSTVPLSIHPLDETRLRHAGLYTRNWSHKDGQFVDDIDRKPFSTSFSFTRFLVPSLCQWYGLALYCDCDFLWRGDVSFLFKSFDREKKAVDVVKHSHNPDISTKMEGQKQTKYYRKNWSSLILYNCHHPSNLMLTPAVVNAATGQWLHGFSWLHSHEIGEVDKSWNYLSGIDLDIDDPLAVHFTNGTPSMKGHENDPYADEWRSVLTECK